MTNLPPDVAMTPEVVEALEFVVMELEAHVGMAEVSYSEECKQHARVLRQLLQQARGEDSDGRQYPGHG